MAAALDVVSLFAHGTAFFKEVKMHIYKVISIYIQLKIAFKMKIECLHQT